MKRLLISITALLVVSAAGCDTFDSSEGETAEEERAEQETAAEDEDRSDDGDSDKAQRAKSDEKDEEGAKEELADDLEPGQEGEYGADFEIEDDPISLAKAIEQADNEEAGPVKIEASVQKVCKKKGCWFTIEDDDINKVVRVRMEDYGFFVPRNLDEGARAVIEGHLRQREVPKEEAQHYADDEVAGTDKEAERIEEDQERWEMKISAARMEQPG